jgi:hypothetical protein
LKEIAKEKKIEKVEKYFESKVESEKLFKVANDVEQSRSKHASSPITRICEPEVSENNNSIKMPPASSPPVLSSWAPILFPPWNSGLLPAAFYPAALRSLPT